MLKESPSPWRWSSLLSHEFPLIFYWLLWQMTPCVIALHCLWRNSQTKLFMCWGWRRPCYKCTYKLYHIYKLLFLYYFFSILATQVVRLKLCRCVELRLGNCLKTEWNWPQNAYISLSVVKIISILGGFVSYMVLFHYTMLVNRFKQYFLLNEMRDTTPLDFTLFNSFHQGKEHDFKCLMKSFCQHR